MGEDRQECEHFTHITIKIKILGQELIQHIKCKKRYTNSTLSLFRSISGTSCVLNGSYFWKNISEGKGWNNGSSIETWENYKNRVA